MEAEAFAKVLEYTTNTFYNPDNQNISVLFGDGNYYDGSKITLSKVLMEAFASLNLPRFTVFYHELGHHLYSHGLFKLEETWRKTVTGPLAYKKQYHHLLNWIEDYYIEEHIVIDYTYLTDILTCIKKIPPEYDINRIEYAFNYWYIHGSPTPALNYSDQTIFYTYVTRLLKLRNTNKTRFGSGPISNLKIKPSNETFFIQTLIEFYAWCQQKGIFPPDDEALPDLNHPSNHLVATGGSDDIGQGDGQDDGQRKEVTSGNEDDEDAPKNKEQSKSGSHHNQGKHIEYKEETHIKKATEFFKEKIVAEQKLIEQQVLDMSQQVHTSDTTIEGLFNPKLKDTSFIQSRVNIPNFFNPNRLIDQILFKQPTRTFINVSIYRDVSGSVGVDTHALMSKVCERLIHDIPVPIDYYLYSDNLYKTSYMQWEDREQKPSTYRRFRTGGSTNSGLIANIITDQFSEKWLNIILTDGDLTDLLKRDNIHGLLQNVFAIYIGTDEIDEGVKGMIVKNEKDIHSLYTMLGEL